MARIIAGIAASHTPAIAFAKDTKSADDPAWRDVFQGIPALARLAGQRTTGRICCLSTTITLLRFSLITIHPSYSVSMTNMSPRTKVVVHANIRP